MSKLERIKAVFDTVYVVNGTQVSTNALDNLEGAIYDIERTNKADEVSMRTLNRVAKQLADIEAILKE